MKAAILLLGVLALQACASPMITSLEPVGYLRAARS